MIDFVTAQIEIEIVQIVINQENDPQGKDRVNVPLETDQEIDTYGKNPTSGLPAKSQTNVVYLKRAPRDLHASVPRIGWKVCTITEIRKGAQILGTGEVDGLKDTTNDPVMTNMMTEDTVGVLIDIKETCMKVVCLHLITMMTIITVGRIMMINDLDMMINLFMVKIGIPVQMIITQIVMIVVAGEACIRLKRGHLIWTLA